MSWPRLATAVPPGDLPLEEKGLGSRLVMESRPVRVERVLYRLCQLSRHEDEAGHVDRSDLVYAAAISPMTWANRCRWMSRRCASDSG
jgi:hypothetical protein